jgi:hypothetical protein
MNEKPGPGMRTVPLRMFASGAHALPIPAGEREILF